MLAEDIQHIIRRETKSNDFCVLGVLDHSKLVCQFTLDYDHVEFLHLRVSCLHCTRDRFAVIGSLCFYPKHNDFSKAVLPCPTLAIYGLQRAIEEGAQKYGADKVKFVKEHFYVDDHLVSLLSEAEAIALLKCKQASLTESLA